VLDSAGVLFAWQHDPEALGHGVYTWFDNESSGNPLLPYSRAITVKLNERSRVATLQAADDQPEGRSAASQGNAQASRDGGLFVGWGSLPYFSQFAAQGPSQQAQLDADLTTTLAEISDGTAKRAGIAAGTQQASAVLAPSQLARPLRPEPATPASRAAPTAAPRRP
jgi:hypothetical protein